jgi:hypothetical protein
MRRGERSMISTSRTDCPFRSSRARPEPHRTTLLGGSRSSRVAGVPYVERPERTCADMRYLTRPSTRHSVFAFGTCPEAQIGCSVPVTSPEDCLGLRSR